MFVLFVLFFNFPFHLEILAGILVNPRWDKGFVCIIVNLTVSGLPSILVSCTSDFNHFIDIYMCVDSLQLQAYNSLDGDGEFSSIQHVQIPITVQKPTGMLESGVFKYSSAS